LHTVHCRYTVQGKQTVNCMHCFHTVNILHCQWRTVCKK